MLKIIKTKRILEKMLKNKLKLKNIPKKNATFFLTLKADYIILIN